MSRGWIPQPEYDRMRRDDANAGWSAGAALVGVGMLFLREKPPAHWRLWSYIWRYTLAIAVPLAFAGVMLAYWASTTVGYEPVTDSTSSDAVTSFFMVGAFGQVVALVVALVVFAGLAPARKHWADYRNAGWTTKQCRAEWKRQKREASSRRY